MWTPVHWIHDIPQGRLGIMPRPRGGDWLEVEASHLQRERVNILVSLLTAAEAAQLELQDEPAACAILQIEFVAFPIEDRGLPDSTHDYLALVQTLAERLTTGDSIGIHCRQGIGRASMLAAGILRATGSASHETWTRLQHARGREVPDTEAQRLCVDRCFEQRARTIESSGAQTQKAPMESPSGLSCERGDSNPHSLAATGT